MSRFSRQVFHFLVFTFFLLGCATTKSSTGFSCGPGLRSKCEFKDEKEDCKCIGLDYPYLYQSAPQSLPLNSPDVDKTIYQSSPLGIPNYIRR
jgi:hypothetical protein